MLRKAINLCFFVFLVKNLWLKWLVLLQFGCVCNSHFDVEWLLKCPSNIVNKTKEKYIILFLSSLLVFVHLIFWCLVVVTIHLSWLSIGVNFINSSWEPTHMIIKTFEVHNMTCNHGKLNKSFDGFILVCLTG